VEEIFDQILTACREIGIALVGGHTEISYGLARPILVGTLIGEITRDRLVTPRGAQPGDHLLLTKGVPIEATAILAREVPGKLVAKSSPSGRPKINERAASNGEWLGNDELAEAQNFLYTPGISVVRDAQLACEAGEVHAMHDPTEGGIYTALWELSEASGLCLSVDLNSVPVPDLSMRICRLLRINPLAAIASGALLLAAPAGAAMNIRNALQANGIPCVEIGHVTEEPGPLVIENFGTTPRRLVPRPTRDAISEIFSA
jgi:hydrogenase maturation factor